MTDYKPIDCALHEQYQLAVMRKASLELVWVDEKAAVQMAQLLPIDVYTRNKAEYLLGVMSNHEKVAIRLDRIRKASWSSGGSALEQS